MVNDQDKWVDSLKVAELKAELKKRNLPQSGLKADLAARLKEALSQAASEADQDNDVQHEDKPVEQTQEEPEKEQMPSKSPHVSKKAGPEPASQLDDPQAERPDAEQRAAEQQGPSKSDLGNDGHDAKPESKPASPHPQPSPTPVDKQQQASPQRSPAAAAKQRDPSPEAEDPPLDYGDEPAPGPASEDDEPTPKPDVQPQPELDPAPAEPKHSQLETVPSGGADGRKRRAPIQFQPRSKTTDKPTPATDTPKAAPPAAAKPATPASAPISLERRATGNASLAPAPSTVGPPAGQPSRAMRIDNLVRPFRDTDLKALIGGHGTIEDFWMPSIKTHALVILETEEQGTAAATALHGLAWPDGSPKRLAVTYLLLEEAQQGIEHGRNPHSKATSPAALQRRASDAGAGARTGAPLAVGAVAAAKAAMAAVTGNAGGPKGSSGVAAGAKRARSASPTKDDSGDAAAGDGEDAAPAKRAREGGSPVAAAPEGGAKEMDVDAKPEVEEEDKVLSLDDLFKKTVAKPPVYWLPLTDEQVKEKKLREAKEEEARARGEAVLAAQHAGMAPYRHTEPQPMHNGATRAPYRR